MNLDAGSDRNRGQPAVAKSNPNLKNSEPPPTGSSSIVQFRFTRPIRRFSVLVKLRFRDREAGHESFSVMCEAEAVHAVS
jgi:hypothetical protein